MKFNKQINYTTACCNMIMMYTLIYHRFELRFVFIVRIFENLYSPG